MRADTKVLFYTRGEEQYDYETGDYIEVVGEPVVRYAYVTHTGIERMQVLYSGIKQDAITVRLNSLFKLPFDYAEIDGTKYKLDMRRHYRHKTVMEMSV